MWRFENKVLVQSTPFITFHCFSEPAEVLATVADVVVVVAIGEVLAGSVVARIAGGSWRVGRVARGSSRVRWIGVVAFSRTIT